MENKTNATMAEYLVFGFYHTNGMEDDYAIYAHSEEEAKMIVEELYPEFKAVSVTILPDDESEDED